MTGQALIHLVWMVPLALLAVYIGSPRHLGTIGPTRVQRILEAALDRKRYTALHGVLLPAGGGTVLIDHIVISRQGIWVVESVYRPGWISGTEVQERWLQKTRGRTRRFANPVHISHLHVQALERILNLPLSRFHPLVVFIGHKGFRSTVPTGVVDASNLHRSIRSRQRELLSGEEVNRVLVRLGDSALKRPLFGRQGRWSLLRWVLFGVLIAAGVAVWHQEVGGLIHELQGQADQRMMPENFHPDGQPKTKIELWEDKLICAYSSDTDRCACYEPDGTRAGISNDRCRELAERGSILKQ